jgi:hypothetical protein
MLVDLLKLRRPFIFTLRFEGYASDERPFDYYRAVDSLLANLLSRGHSAPLA